MQKNSIILFWIFFLLLFFEPLVFGQKTLVFQNESLYFSDGNCAEIDDYEEDNDIIEFLQLHPNTGICSDTLSINCSNVENLSLLFSGISFKESTSNTYFKFSIKDSSQILSLLFSPLISDSGIQINSNADTLTFSNIHGQSIIGDSTFSIDGAKGSVGFLSFNLMSVGYISKNGFIILVLDFFDHCTISNDNGSISGDRFFLHSSLSLSPEVVEVIYHDYLAFLAIEGIAKNIDLVNSAYVPDTLKLGMNDFTIIADNANFVERIRLDGIDFDFEVIDNFTLKVITNELYFLPEEIRVESSLNSISLNDFSKEPEIIEPQILDNPAWVLENNEKFSLYFDWYENDSAFNGYYQIVLRDESNEIVSQIVTLDSFFSWQDLDRSISPFTLEFSKYFNGKHDVSRVINVDILNDQRNILFHTKLQPILENWIHDDSLDLIGALIVSDINPLISRAYLQVINDGEGFNDPQYPWNSTTGHLKYIKGTGEIIINPPLDSITSPCKCTYGFVSSADVNGLNHESSLSNLPSGYYQPRIGKSVDVDKPRSRRWTREQINGAAVYTETFSLGKGSSRSRHTNQNWNSEKSINTSNVKAGDPPGDSFSEIKAIIHCFRFLNGRIRPCHEICEVPAVFEGRYNSIIYANREWNSGSNREYETWAHDEVNIAFKEGQNGDWKITAAGHLMVVDNCESNTNPEWWRSFASFFGNIFPLLSVDTSGLNINWESLTPQAAVQIINNLTDLVFFIDYKTLSGTCDYSEAQKMTVSDGNYVFTMKPNLTYFYRISTRQSIHHKGRRVTLRTRNLSDYSLAFKIGQDSYAGAEWDMNRDSCCHHRYGAYAVGSHDTLWRNGPNRPNDIYPDSLSTLVRRGYGDLRSGLSSFFGLYGLVPVGGFTPSVNFDNTLRGDYFLCDENNHAGSLKLINETNLGYLIHQGQSIQVRSYPNPTSGSLLLNIDYDHLLSDKIKIMVFDLGGKTTYTTNIASGLQHFEIPQAAFPSSGLYLLKVDDGVESIHQSIIKL